MTTRPILALLAAAVLSTSCGGNPTDASGDSLASEVFLFQFPTRNIESVRLTGLNGNISVVAVAAQPTVLVTGMKHVRSSSEKDAQEHLADIEIDLTQTGSDAILSTLIPADAQGRQYSVDFTLQVAEDFPVRVTNTNGNIDVLGHRAGLMVTNANGNITFEAVEGDVTAVNTNGTIQGDILLHRGGTLNLQTTNGGITVSIPDTSSATLSATSTNGNVSLSGFDLSSVTSSSSSAVGMLGAGDGTITLTTINGDITLSSF
jgi:DUF4097 and DUF4098 domain-containing protein YvlB